MCYIRDVTAIELCTDLGHIEKTEEKNMNEMSQRFCQCCGMPMGEAEELFGTNADGSRNEEYCKYCFEKGEFTFKGTMEEMIEECVPNMAAANPDMTEEEARNGMLEWFPTLKRWKK